MDRSVGLLGDYFRECAVALDRGTTVERLRRLGCAAEQRMLQRFGTNTHRGAIFLGGLLLAGAHRAGSCDERSVRKGVADAALKLFATRLPSGTTTLRRCGVVGLRKLRADGRRLEALLLDGENPTPYLMGVDRNLSFPEDDHGRSCGLVGSVRWLAPLFEAGESLDRTLAQDPGISRRTDPRSVCDG